MKSEKNAESPWRQVTGVILYSDVEYVDDYFQPVVKYRYEVDGVSYEGDSIVKGLVSINWRGPARRWANRFPVGDTVPVFVDVADPRKCFLQLGWDPYFPVVVTIVSVVAVVIILLIVFG
jgi:hypothetical protein